MATGEVLSAPVSGTTTAVILPLIWNTDPANAKQLIPLHFNIQIAKDASFTQIVSDVHSRDSASLSAFQYESSPGVWTALPSNGLAAANIGKRVRYTPPSLIINTTYFWRVRSEQFLS